MTAAGISKPAGDSPAPRLLLLSNSTLAGEEFLAYPAAIIREFLTPSITGAVFVPYAAVTFSWDVYSLRAAGCFQEWGIALQPVHRVPDPVAMLESAPAIVVGGGNTFHLLYHLYRHKLLDPIRAALGNGIPYIGWSAGANVACPTIMTTNDMPIINPPGLEALGLVPFQINPHYRDGKPEGHQGESREDRIREFIELHRNQYVAGLREGTGLEIQGTHIRYHGEQSLRIFRYGSEPGEYGSAHNLDFLLQ